jgi:tRNA (guanine26-N2/guanine27-N2)-dimethyltransferase
MTRSRGPAHRAAVFYNPAMALNRDLSVAAVATEGEGRGSPLRAWDMLAASGVRALRWVREVPARLEVFATELHPDALAILHLNAQEWARGCLKVRAHDAREVPEESPFDVVDLDPYGTPVPYLESAYRSLSPGGLLQVTATDMAVLAGPEKRTCERRYGARPVRNFLCREAGLRILVGFVARQARQYGRLIRPLVCYAHDHYVRALLRVDASPDGIPLPLAVLPYEGYDGPPLPARGPGGPVWIGPLLDRDYLARLRTHRPRKASAGLVPLIERLLEEAEVPAPFYYEVGERCHSLKLSRVPPREEILASLKRRGWKATRTHLTPTGWKTDAPREVVDQVLLDLVAGRGAGPSVGTPRARVPSPESPSLTSSPALTSPTADPGPAGECRD